MVQTLFSHSFMPSSFGHHALQMTTYLLNIDFSTLTSLFYNRAPSYNHLRVFGCLCFPLYPPSTIHKLHSRSTPCIFLGYSTNIRDINVLTCQRIRLLSLGMFLLMSLSFLLSKFNLPHHLLLYFFMTLCILF